MGMYDTVNGEQVKCFPWVSLYNNEISYHGGDLKYYGLGDEVPYKTPYYNYGKNFIVLDINKYPESDFWSYDYIIHVIVDGKVKDTFKNKIGEIDWNTNEHVVGYSGELINAHSPEDVISYIEAQRKYWTEYENVRSHWRELLKKSMEYINGIGLLDKDSEERKFRETKLNEIHELMDIEYERIAPELKRLSEEFSKWFISDIEDLINLGCYISAYNLKNQETQAQCEQMIRALLASDKTLYNRYVAWQDSDEHIKEFKTVDMV